MNKQTLRFVVLAGLFLVPFVPFLVSSSLFFPFITTKAFVFRIIVEIVFATWLVLALIDAEYRPKKSPILYAIGTFLLVIGVANIFGIDPGKSFWSNFERMEGYITLLHLGAFFIVIGSVFKNVEWKRWWNTSLVASGLMVLYCLFQLGGVATINQGGVRVDGTFGNASYLAVYMLIHIFIAGLFMWREWKNKGLRYAYILLMLGQLFILYHTATRGAILGLLGGLLIVALLNIKNRDEKRVRKLSLGLLGAVVLIVGGFFVLKDTSFVTSSPVLARFATISTEELKSGGRAFVWPMAVEGVKERPILGWGQENFIYIFQKHYSPEMYRIEPWFDRAHNIFLDWAVAGGMLGLLAYLSLYAVLLYVIWRKDAALGWGEKSILTGMIAAYFFHNFFVFDHLISYILFFSLLAYIYSRNSSALLWQKSLLQEQGFKFTLPAISVLLVLTFYFVNVKPISANTALISALQNVRAGGSATLAIEGFEKAYRRAYMSRGEATEQLAANAVVILESQIPVSEKNEFYSFAREALVNEAERSSQSAKHQLVAGSFLSMTGNSAEAEKFLLRGAELSPGKQAFYFELGTNLINSKKYQEALPYFKQAYEMAPGYTEARIIYLLGAIYAGDRNLERKMLSELSETDVAFDDRILSIYYNNKRFVEVIAILELRKKLDPEKSAQYDELIRQVRQAK